MKLLARTEETLLGEKKDNILSINPLFGNAFPIVPVNGERFPDNTLVEFQMIGKSTAKIFREFSHPDIQNAQVASVLFAQNISLDWNPNVLHEAKKVQKGKIPNLS